MEFEHSRRSRHGEARLGARTGRRVELSPATPAATTVTIMCRNITTLRGLEPSATPEEIEAAARQYVRKVSGVQSVSDATREPFEQAVAEVTATTTRLLAQLPERRQPPRTVPPLRRPEVQAREAAKRT
ncbi:hypothetical protein GCM10009675_03640 [Prauserella alba]|uniref:DUF2277 domain-containing protein n=2 Tax=Prauserella alba TaxID=176898 RepID=A0ABP4FNX9_9PSEU